MLTTKMAEHDKTTRRFSYFVAAFRVTGIPLLMDRVSPLYWVYAAVATVCCYASYSAQVVDLLKNTRDLERTMETARVVAGAGMTVWIYGFLRFRINSLERLLHLAESFVWEDLPTTDPETGSMAAAGWIPRIESVTRRLINITLIFHFSYVIIKRAVSSKPQLSYNTWYPFDISSTIVFELVNISQLLAALIYTLMLLGFNGLYATLVCIACSQLQKLRANLLDIRQKQDTAEHPDPGAETGHEERQKVHAFYHMQDQLNDCVRHHQQILSYIRAMEETFSPMMVVIFLLDLASLCLGSFSIVTSWGNYVQMSQGIVTYGLLLLVLAIYCWFGYELSYQAENVRDAAWGCDWVGTPVSFQKSIRLIISSANKEFTLTAGKIVPVTISTLVTMVNQSVSYFMFLLEVKKNIEHSKIN
ncbi:hypothetical protein L798_06891 [Zootermopsis nevadensis]|uniref:Odorant receptor n=1 Tax=Zootermopsis nevadensis TaxID=136037 RepID=A0A067QH32_ZOONE|nr:hypothetical protein L798_06891 [Zootermopsis nevadensis]